MLLEEDEAQLRKGVAIVLARNGYKVFEASAAKEAACAFERENGQFDLIFTDLQKSFEIEEMLRAVKRSLIGSDG